MIRFLRVRCLSLKGWRRGSLARIKVADIALCCGAQVLRQCVMAREALPVLNATVGIPLRHVRERRDQIKNSPQSKDTHAPRAVHPQTYCSVGPWSAGP